MDITIEALIAALGWAVENNCAVVSMSIGDEFPTTVFSSGAMELAASAALAAGTLIVAGAGNDSMRPNLIQPMDHPANCKSIMAVAAIDQTKTDRALLQRRAGVRGTEGRYRRARNFAFGFVSDHVQDRVGHEHRNTIRRGRGRALRGGVSPRARARRSGICCARRPRNFRVTTRGISARVSFARHEKVTPRCKAAS